eukprot:TRINITY_DN81607_c0_g1_i1.p1 TRINITY_DN81607_c0_g1~~TRINITY_DN81607_c0_g1_i1.p1  ORF type:complete len:152 (-),score=42.07 TRINITY_DN81607_c0_g1_i1:87-542(-)
MAAARNLAFFLLLWSLCTVSAGADTAAFASKAQREERQKARTELRKEQRDMHERLQAAQQRLDQELKQEREEQEKMKQELEKLEQKAAGTSLSPSLMLHESLFESSHWSSRGCVLAMVSVVLATAAAGIYAIRREISSDESAFDYWPHVDI